LRIITGNADERDLRFGVWPGLLRWEPKRLTRRGVEKAWRNSFIAVANRPAANREASRQFAICCNPGE